VRKGNLIAPLHENEDKMSIIAQQFPELSERIVPPRARRLQTPQSDTAAEVAQPNYSARRQLSASKGACSYKAIREPHLSGKPIVCQDRPTLYEGADRCGRGHRLPVSQSANSGNTTLPNRKQTVVRRQSNAEDMD
jgi:hypothetical protein